MNLNSLKTLNLSTGQIAVYQAVLELGITSLNGIQEKTGIERRNIYDILNKLIERGLISYIEEKGRKTFQITHPDKIAAEVAQKETELANIKKQMPAMIDMFNSEKPDVKAEVYRGNEAMKAFLTESLAYDTYWIGGNNGIENNCSDDMKRWFKHWMDERVKKKRWMHDLADAHLVLKGLEAHKLDVHKKNYYKYAELPEQFSSPMVIIMFGNKVAQVLWAKQPFAFVLESVEIKESFMKYFNYFWKESKK